MEYKETLGIVASIFVFISFICDDPNRIRAINCIGSLLFVWYSLLIGSISLFILNVATMILQLYQIWKGTKQKTS